MKKSSIIFLAIGLVLVLFISEITYAYNHLDILGIYAFKTAKTLATWGKKDASFWVVTKAGKISARKNKTVFEEINAPQDLKDETIALILSLPPESFERSGGWDLGRFYYEVSIISYSKGYKELSPKFLGNAVSYNPLLSFWYIELSNYYLIQDSQDSARKIIEDCSLFEAPNNDCKKFLISNIEESKPEAFGFLRNVVKNYFEGGLR